MESPILALLITGSAQSRQSTRIRMVATVWLGYGLPLTSARSAFEIMLSAR